MFDMYTVYLNICGIWLFVCILSHIYIYICVCVCMYVCMYVCRYVCMYVWMDGWMHACMHACMYDFLQLYIYIKHIYKVGICIYTYLWMCTFIFPGQVWIRPKTKLLFRDMILVWFCSSSTELGWRWSNYHSVHVAMHCIRGNHTRPHAMLQHGIRCHRNMFEISELTMHTL